MLIYVTFRKHFTVHSGIFDSVMFVGVGPSDYCSNSPILRNINKHPPSFVLSQFAAPELHVVSKDIPNSILFSHFAISIHHDSVSRSNVRLPRVVWDGVNTDFCLYYIHNSPCRSGLVYFRVYTR